VNSASHTNTYGYRISHLLCSTCGKSFYATQALADGRLCLTCRRDAPAPTDTGFRKSDAGKPQLELLALMPPLAAAETGKALEYGGRKYGFDNHRKGTNWRRYAAAATRHLFAWLKGETNDPESGLNHLAHCAASVLIVLDMQLSGLGTDDRFVNSPRRSPPQGDAKAVTHATPSPETQR
jgi:hypothetical protein